MSGSVQGYGTMDLIGDKRTALWWRQAGFPVPPGVPDKAIGTVTRTSQVLFEYPVERPAPLDSED